MALINRFSRLIKADLHAMLDYMEEPDLLLKQNLREMEADIDESEHCLKGLRHDQEGLSRHIQDCEQILTDMDAELGLCFESNNEKLARTLIKRKLEANQLLKHLRRKCKLLTDILEKRRHQLEEHRKQYDALRQKVQLLEHDVCNDDFPASNTVAKYGSIKPIGNDEVEIAFLREKKQRLLAQEGREHE